MQHFSQDVVGKHVVDVHGVDIGRVTDLQDGYAMLKAETGVAARMEASLSPPDVDGLALEPEQVEEVTLSERKPTPSGVGVSDSIAWQSTHYDSSGCSTASSPALMISR